MGRTLYPEYHMPLEAAAAVELGRWHHFKVEVADGRCHFYVGDMDVPQLTFPHFEGKQGRIGLQPRSVGDPVWVDNVKVTSIAKLSYSGPERPAEAYAPESLLRTWEVIGPLAETDDDVARAPERHRERWRSFATDARGAVVTGMVTDYHGPKTVAYFRTIVEAEADAERVLHLSSIDDLALWVNGRFHWFIPRRSAAWFDFGRNPAHAGQRIPIDLRRGRNELVFRVRGGVYASGGFFARVE